MMERLDEERRHLAQLGIGAALDYAGDHREVDPPGLDRVELVEGIGRFDELGLDAAMGELVGEGAGDQRARRHARTGRQRGVIGEGRGGAPGEHAGRGEGGDAEQPDQPDRSGLGEARIRLGVGHVRGSIHARLHPFDRFPTGSARLPLRSQGFT